MKTIIFFPGLAANEILFSRLEVEGWPKQIIDYPIPFEKESLQAYVKRLAPTVVRNTDLIYIGVSLGGIIAQELSKSIPANKIIIISSISSYKEKPFFFNLVKWFPFYKVLSEEYLKKSIKWAGRTFTKKNPEEQAFFESMVNSADVQFIKWGIEKALDWRQERRLPNLIRIHGSKDKLFPLGTTHADYVIEGGEHFMIVQRGKEISLLLNKLLNDSPD